MSVNTLNKALRIMGCDTAPGGHHCAHGLRSTARRDEVVRRQLGKGDKNKIRGIYNRAAYWAEHVRIMQHWSPYAGKERR
jgi:hypothetical protein